MPKSKKQVMRSSRAIVAGHLERISSGIFERYHEQIAGLTDKRQVVINNV